MSAELIDQARRGDDQAFRELVEPYRRELHVHCYRMLGSFQDAEDALQDTLLAAWQGLRGFEGRASIRTWLYRVATNRCLNALRSAGRRTAKESVAGLPRPSRTGEIVWLEPYPDVLLAGALDGPLGPEARYEQTETISLAFVTALQVLPARQRAVLVLRDVLGYRADEVAGMLDSTVASVHSALKRARVALRDLPASDPPLPDSPVERGLVARLARAYQTGDVDALVRLLTDDVRVSMPPLPVEYLGRVDAAAFFATVLSKARGYHLVHTRANGHPAFGTYLRDPVTGVRHAAGLQVISVRGDRIRAITRFDNGVLPSFGLPRSL